MNKIQKFYNFIKRKPRAYKKLMKRKRINRAVEGSVAKRRAAEKRLKAYGIIAISISVMFLFSLLYSIISKGYSAFVSSEIKLSVNYSKELVEEDNFLLIIKEAIRSEFPEVSKRNEQQDLDALVSTKAMAYRIKDFLSENPENTGKIVDVWVLLSSDADMYIKGKVDTSIDEKLRRLNDRQLAWLDELKEKGLIKKSFNTTFFSSGDSSEPETAGILGSLIGSIFVIISCMLVAFPLGVMTAIYLEEFAPKNKFTDFIEVNINNLAAVPSIVFGLLGVVVYIQMFGLPRSSSLVGGLTLAMMALPIIVIATRTSIRAIPQSIRDGATALGASKVQTTLHHVLPLAMPGIMTGTILSIARVLGETAPLLMVGLNAFVVDMPQGFTSAATVMPTQIYRWSDTPEYGFKEKASAAIIVLLVVLIFANALAVYLRKKFEIRW
ncbi:MAG: phosphate ABC transporter permease PstA [Rickettsiales bacterium]|nr:phosphate ABC transporter permease PstA [Pseudomonadota bacterium]MDA0966973.1 phosphate ABC transporter permease PstA [Pseudomonadota bacterium]MDG4543892.1 phosphate ABC transporter permease PstA [Rickettsiales bacterium]MDG4546038.1 phosphate ABC transporter permease PstA [Rickettsiales bacterium]MDG4548284.1 phosphate ABC transporter permease PstA [Rickettsiales bacterium]